LLAIAALTAIARLTVIHRAIFAAFLARRLICRERHRANHRRENRKENFGVAFHTRFNLTPQLKLRERFMGDRRLLRVESSEADRGEDRFCGERY
jgi:hypothetical protein